MARVYDWIVGGIVGMEENQSGVPFAPELAILPYVGCPVAYKAVHTSIGQNFEIQPLRGLGNSVDFATAANVDRRCVEYYFALSGNPAAPLLLNALDYTVSVTDVAKVGGFLEFQTDGTIKVTAQDTFTLLATITPNMTANAYKAMRIAQERTSSTAYRLRIWLVDANANNWGNPVVDIANATITAAGHTGTRGGSLWSFDFKGTANPAVTHYIATGVCYQFATDADLDAFALPRLFRGDPVGVSASNAQFTLLGAPSAANVDDLASGVPDDAGTQDADPAGGATADQTYTVTPWGPTTPPMCVAGYSRLHTTSRNTRFLLVDTTDSVPSASATTGAWQPYCVLYNTPPNSGGVWSPGLWNTLEAGGRRSGAGASDVAITRTELLGLYFPASLPPPRDRTMRRSGHSGVMRGERRRVGI